MTLNDAIKIVDEVCSKAQTDRPNRKIIDEACAVVFRAATKEEDKQTAPVKDKPGNC